MGALHRQNLKHTLQTLAFAAFLLICTLPAHAQDYTSNLVGHWTLDDTTGTTIVDSAGANTGTWSEDGADDVAEETGAGQIDDALTFDRADTTVISVSNESNFDFEITDSFTIAGWVNRTDDSTLNTIFSKIPDSFGPTIKGYSLAITETGHGSCGNCLSLLMADGFTAMLTSYSGTVGTADGWTHVAATYDGSNTIGGITLYIDGAVVAPTSTTDVGTITTILNNENPTISKTGNDLPGFDGALDDVRVYSRELTAPDIAALHAYTGGTPGTYTGPITCDADYEAVMWFNKDENVMQYCNGTNWISMGAGIPSARTENLVGHWPLDDAIASGTAAEEISGNNGTVTGTITFDPSSGQIGGAAEFPDGNGNYISIPDVPALKPSLPLTISTWWNPTDVTQSQIFLQNEDWAQVSGLYYGALLNYFGGELEIGYGDGTNSNSSARRVKKAAYSFSNGQWYHLTGVIRSATDMSLYVNGVDIGGAYEGSGGAAVVYSTNQGKMGHGNSTRNIDGYLDDVRLYNDDLSAQDVANLYVAGGGSIVNTGTCSSPDGRAGEVNYNASEGQMQYCNGAQWISMGPKLANAGSGSGITYEEPTDNLVGHWKLDEISGTSIADSSGNAITGTAGGMGTDVVSVAGSVDTAISFDGSNDRISLGTTNTLRLEDDVTFSAWINPIDPPADGVGAIYARAVSGVSGVLLMIDSAGEILLVDDDNDVAAETSTGPVQFNAGWQHIAVVKTAADNVKFYYNGAYVSQDTLDLNAASGTNAYIGRYHNDPCCGFDGDIDDLRVYDAPLSDAEIYALYQTTGGSAGGDGLVGHWKLDETTATTTATDSSASGNNGTMTSMTGTANTTLGSSGTALTFDGTADYIDIGDPVDGSLDFGTSQDFTLSAWVKYVDSGFVISKYTGGFTKAYWLGTPGGFAEIAIRDASGGGASEIVQVAGSISIDDGNWHMITATYDRDGDGKLYVDGVLDATADISGITDGIDNTAAVRIGARDNNGSLGAFEGSIDDARIYSRLLSAEEVADLYVNTGGAFVAADCTGLGDAQYTAADGNCYFREDSTADWPTAQANCEAEDAYLAVITSDAENTAIYTNLSIGATETYIGGSDIASEGSWVWAGGEQAGVEFWAGTAGGSASNGLYTNWAPTEPNAGTAAQDALTMALNSDDEWADSTSTIARPYICEKSANTGTRCSSPSGTPGEIFYNDDENLMQGCAGGTWLALGPAPGTGSSGPAPPPIPTGCPVIGNACDDGSLYAGDVDYGSGDEKIYVTDVNQGTYQWESGGGRNNIITPDSSTDGYLNLIYAAYTITDYPALNACSALSRHTNDDWYLPSLNELLELNANRAAINAEAGEAFDTVTRYWGSTESVTGTFAVHVSLNGGANSYSSQANSRNVRCIRRPTAPVPTFSPTNCPVIGDQCDDGSIFAGDTNLYVTNGGAEDLQWKTSTGSNDINPDSDTDGQANHDNRGGAIANFPAFEYCENLVRHNQTDWYLPAIDELSQLYDNKAAIEASGDVFYVSGAYFASSEASNNGADILDFSNGNLLQTDKDNLRDVRCVRRE